MTTPRTHRAFTLIEAMVSVGVIGILLGLALPAIRSARAFAGGAASLANLGSLGMTLEQRVQVSQGRYPMAPRARAGRWGPLLWEPPGDNGAALHYYGDIWWYGRTFWPALLHDVAPWPEHFETWLSPGLDVADGDEPIWVRAPEVSYDYATCFYAKPSVWTEHASPTGADIVAVTASVVAFPSAKVIAYDRDMAYLRGARGAFDRPLLLADGAGVQRRDSAAQAPVPNPLNHGRAQRYHDTPHGAAGRDF